MIIFSYLNIKSILILPQIINQREPNMKFYKFISGLCIAKLTTFEVAKLGYGNEVISEI